MRVYQAIPIALHAWRNCLQSGNLEWADKWDDRLEWIERNMLPHGSGFDAGTTIDRDSTSSRLILHTSFHHMNENGYYDGWTEHSATVQPDLVHEFNMRITGRNRNDIKDYIADTLHHALQAAVTWEEMA